MKNIVSGNLTLLSRFTGYCRGCPGIKLLETRPFSLGFHVDLDTHPDLATGLIVCHNLQKRKLKTAGLY